MVSGGVFTMPRTTSAALPPATGRAPGSACSHPESGIAHHGFEGIAQSDKALDPAHLRRRNDFGCDFRLRHWFAAEETKLVLPLGLDLSRIVRRDRVHHREAILPVIRLDRIDDDARRRDVVARAFV